MKLSNEVAIVVGVLAELERVDTLVNNAAVRPPVGSRGTAP